MKYHYFTKGYPNSHRYIAGGEQCIYCNLFLIELWNYLPDKHILQQNYINKPNRREIEEKIYAIYLPCEFGLSEEEYIIKGIIE